MDLHLLVVANACADGTERWLGAQGASDADALPMRWLSEPEPGKSHALNRAIAALTDGWLTFVDDDHRIAADFFQAIYEGHLRYPEATLLCGRVIPDWDGREPAWVHDKGRYRIYPLPVPNFQLGGEPLIVESTMSIPGGGNLAVARSVFERIGGFATELGPRGHDLGGSEDTDFVLRALGQGERLQYLPDMLQYHYVDLKRLTLGYLLRKGYQRSRSITRVRHPSATSVPPYLWRKAASYAARALFSINAQRSRFYLVRLASTFGEMRGIKENLKTPQPSTGLEDKAR
jgi:GT2 family glycosyltransferase